MQEILDKKYEDSIFYIIESCSKYFNKLFEQYFKQNGIGLSPVEHLALKVISDTKECSQRDLARIILKDRANTGKLASSLEKKGLIKIELKVKNNRPVKILTVTKKGLEQYNNILNAAKPVLEKINNEISQESLNNAIKTIKDFKRIVQNAVEIDI